MIYLNEVWFIYKTMFWFSLALATISIVMWGVLGAMKIFKYDRILRCTLISSAIIFWTDNILFIIYFIFTGLLDLFFYIMAY